MIIVKNYVSESNMFITSLSHEELANLATEKMSCAYPLMDDSKQKTYWIAEPSALRMLDTYCAENGHVFAEIALK